MTFATPWPRSSTIPGTLPGRPVDPDNWHITLRFLGRTEPVQRDLVLADIDEHVAQAPFTLGFGGLGAFPRPGRATVLWLGIEQGADELGWGCRSV